MNSKRRRSHSPVEHMEGNGKESEVSGRKDDTRDLENDTSNARSGRGQEYVRHSDRHSSGAPRESRRHDDYRRYHDKRADDNDRGHRTSRSERESRADTYYDRTKRDGTSDRSRGDWRNVDSRYDDKLVRREHRSKNQERQDPSRDYPRYDGEHDKYSDGRKQGHNSRRYPEEKESKNKETAKQEEALNKRTGKEIEKMSSIAEPEARIREKRSLFSSVGPDFENAQLNDKVDTSRKIPSLDCSKDGVMINSASVFKDGGIVNSVDAAKVAAMKAAELVNKNLVGFGVGAGRLSTDQKKKLLWGNKKSNPPESSTHWDSNMFSDRERQEKFNKLMSLRMPWWLWPVVGSEEQQLSPGEQQGRQQGRGLVGCQEAGGAGHRPGEALHSWPAPERRPDRGSWPVVVEWPALSCSCYRIGQLWSSFRAHIAGMCGCLTGFSPVELQLVCFVLAPELLFLRDALTTVKGADKLASHACLSSHAICCFQLLLLCRRMMKLKCILAKTSSSSGLREV
ncbi:pre-mRNA-processing ATP-dependent RNA helicase PRP5 [Oryza brachyantha]|nr:pre-mRNA-processing ATP-dependent RNA helicase PRP5 [Oryza brachyantha]